MRGEEGNEEGKEGVILCVLRHFSVLELGFGLGFLVVVRVVAK